MMDQNDIDKLYGNRFFKRRIKKCHNKEVNTAKVIYDMFKPKRVFDIGCALGSYLLKYKHLGCDVSGCDKYFDNAKKYCDPDISPHLYSKDAGEFWKDDVENKFDLVQCIEVAEHLPSDGSINLIHNICNAASKYVLFTAAPPGQRGTGHINCKKKEFWIRAFSTFNFIHDIEKDQKVKDALLNIDGHLIIRNIMIFKKVS